MNCSEFQNIIFPFIDGDLSSDGHSSADEHLRSCTSCSDRVAELRHLMDALREIQFPAPSPVYWGSVLPRVRASVEQKRSPSIAEFILRTVFPAAASLAVLVALLILPLTHDVLPEELKAGLRQSAPEEMQALAEQFSFTLSANPLSPHENVDLRATEDRDQILSIFHSDQPALSAIEDEHLRAFDGFTEKELGQLLAAADNPAIE